MKSHIDLLRFSSFCLLLLTCFGAQAQNDSFPGRKIYTYVPVMELQELQSRFDEAVIVDVRSGYEYDTLHIKGAKLVPLHDPAFTDKIAELREQNSGPIVFYCNGHTCYKSYEACEKALALKIPNVYAYDAGIFDWASVNPDRSVLLGKSPINPNDLISDKMFKARLLEPHAFIDAANSNAIILDIREPVQRDGIALFPVRQKSIALDRKKELNQLLTQARKDGSTLLVYDEAGKQVNWFQYYLEAFGIKSYYFMKGGAKEYYKQVLKAK